ncbi:MAG: hypothetical protein QF464_24550 [Myxococcota bacterium]|nr:hypothetical protein [Myxococcota bacterium]
MLEALPWVISTCAVLAVLVMTVLQGCARRRGQPSPATIDQALGRSRRAARAQADTDLERIAGALESSNAEELLAAEVDDLEGGS